MQKSAYIQNLYWVYADYISRLSYERTFSVPSFKAEIFSNGDTRKQLLARSRYLLFKNPDKWSVSQRAEILFEQYDDIKQFYYLSLRLGQIYSCNSKKDEARVNMALWFNGCGRMGISAIQYGHKDIYEPL